MLFRSEVAKAQAEADADRERRLKEVEIDARRQMVELYDKAPVLVDMEKLRLQYEHERELTQVQMQTYLQAFQALVPSMEVRIYGGGDQTTRIITELMQLAQGVRHLGEEVPAVGHILEGKSGVQQPLFSRLSHLGPYFEEAVADMNPRIFSSLKLADLMERLMPVVAGQEDAVTALNHLKSDANFRVVGNLPVAPLFRLLGLEMPQPGPSDMMMAGEEAAGEAESEIKTEAEAEETEDEPDIEVAEEAAGLDTRTP